MIRGIWKRDRQPSHTSEMCLFYINLSICVLSALCWSKNVLICHLSYAVITNNCHFALLQSYISTFSIALKAALVNGTYHDVKVCVSRYHSNSNSMFQHVNEGVKFRTKITDMIDTLNIHGYFCCIKQMKYMIRMWKRFSVHHFATNMV
jgi:hypothetical protein